MLLSKSSLYPNGIGNSSGHVGHNFCEHMMGPSIFGFQKELIGKPKTNDDGRPGSFYIPRFQNLDGKKSEFLRGYGFEGGSGTSMVPGTAFTTPGFGEEYKRNVRQYAGAMIEMGAFGEVLARYENAVDIDPNVKIHGASPCFASAISSARTKQKWRRTWLSPGVRCSKQPSSR